MADESGAEIEHGPPAMGDEPQVGQQFIVEGNPEENIGEQAIQITRIVSGLKDDPLLGRLWLVEYIDTQNGETGSTTICRQGDRWVFAP
jgi:hypothetical protein